MHRILQSRIVNAIASFAHEIEARSMQKVRGKKCLKKGKMEFFVFDFLSDSHFCEQFERIIQGMKASNCKKQMMEAKKGSCDVVREGE